jgi:hypothetical protein
MSHYACIDNNNIVTQVIVAEQDFIDSGAVGDPATWFQTSYNTLCGEHKLGGTPFRKNYAGIGFKYDADRDAFIPPKPYNSWVLNENTCQWAAPVDLPVDGKVYKWDENTISWVEVIRPLLG